MRSSFLAFAVVAVASAAHAASLSVSSDKLTYMVGETVTLIVTGDDAGASSSGIFGRLDYSGALVDNGTRSQMTLNPPWISGVLIQGDNGINAFSWAFNQIALPAYTATTLPAAFSTVTLIATAVGVVNVSWHTQPDGDQLSFFGLTNAPGTSFTIAVPEPATAALLCMGLLAITAVRNGRRGSCDACYSPACAPSGLLPPATA